MRAIKVLDYNPSWPRLFAEISTEVSALLGDRLLSIDHIGSTSVPGLAANAKIDLAAVMISDVFLPAAIEVVRAADFVFHGDTGEQRWAFTRDHEGHGFKLYLCGPDNRSHRERILFRDYLRDHPERAKAYAELKRRLAAEAGGDWDFYTGGKTAFVSETVRLGCLEDMKWSAPALHATID
ncbi:GrpB family protein [Rhizobium leguminosarum]|uniref:GrpB family protein n=1 Tax=Rhizobium leguminosarum TaxID=384 RepID=UPI00037F9AA3|nr:GrpB family protein [Rhizobium leguminosarum]